MEFKILTLNQELPQITPEEFLEQLPAPRKKPVLELDLNKNYTQEDLDLIKELDLIAPLQLVGFKRDKLKEYEVKVKQLRKETSDKTKGSAKTEEAQKVKAKFKKK